MRDPVNPVSASATATLRTAVGVFHGALLIAAGASATAVIRRGGASGEVIGRLSAAANTTETFLPPFVIHGSDFHVTLAGTGAEFTAYF